MQLFPALPEVVRGMFRRPEALAVCPPGGGPRERGMFLNQTANYGLSQWEATDRILMEDFNSDNSKIDAALKANADAIAAETTARASGDLWVRLLDLTVEAETQKWDIDLSGIDLTKYQKLLLCPHLKGNTDQWVYVHINGTETECGQVPMINEPARQNFGVNELIFLPELPKLCILQMGATSIVANPGFAGVCTVELGAGTTHIDTLGLWFNGVAYRILEGSSIQIYGFRK